MKAAAKTYWPYAALSLAVMLPLLLPGYILTLDAVFVPHLAGPSGFSNDALWQLLLHVLNVVLPSQVIEKLIFVAIPLAASVSMHQLVGYIRQSLPSNKKDSWTWAP